MNVTETRIVRTCSSAKNAATVFGALESLNLSPKVALSGKWVDYNGIPVDVVGKEFLVHLESKRLRISVYERALGISYSVHPDEKHDNARWIVSAIVHG